MKTYKTKLSYHSYLPSDSDALTIITEPSKKPQMPAIINTTTRFAGVSIDCKWMEFPLEIIKDLQMESLHIYADIDYNEDSFSILYNIQKRGTVIYWYVCAEPHNWWSGNVKKQERIDAIAAILS